MVDGISLKDIYHTTKILKKMKKLGLIIVLSGLMLIAGKTFGYFNVTGLASGSTVYTTGDQAEAKFPEGAKIYKEKCVACHQVTGMGVPGAFPPLKGSDYLKADKKRAVAQVLNGSTDPITVNGVKYTIPMPHQVDTHEEAVAVINYVLNAWGNNYGTISLDEVKDIKIIRE